MNWLPLRAYNFACAMMNFQKLLLFLSSFFTTFDSLFGWFYFLLFSSDNNHCCFLFFCLPNISLKRTIQYCVLAKKHHSLTFRHKLLLNRHPTRCFCTGRKCSFRVIGRNCPACGLHYVLLGEWGLDCVPWRLGVIVPCYQWRF